MGRDHGGRQVLPHLLPLTHPPRLDHHASAADELGITQRHKTYWQWHPRAAVTCGSGAFRILRRRESRTPHYALLRFRIAASGLSRLICALSHAVLIPVSRSTISSGSNYPRSPPEFPASGVRAQVLVAISTRWNRQGFGGIWPNLNHIPQGLLCTEPREPEVQLSELPDLRCLQHRPRTRFP
jgi:hypothetical protein